MLRGLTPFLNRNCQNFPNIRCFLSSASVAGAVTPLTLISALARTLCDSHPGLNRAHCARFSSTSASPLRKYLLRYPALPQSPREGPTATSDQSGQHFSRYFAHPSPTLPSSSVGFRPAETPMDFVGDLIGAESRKNGTRGGRADFTWDSVRDNEKSYYLGNSIANPSASRRHTSTREHDWYSKLPAAATQSSAAPPRPSVDQMQDSIDDLKHVREREKAIMERVLLGRSFSDAVRSALHEGNVSGIDDENNNPLAAQARHAARERRKTEKAERKEMRQLQRQERRLRREQQHRRQTVRQDTQTSRPYSSDSEIEGHRSRYDDTTRRRRRRERGGTGRRKRHEFTTSTDSDSNRRATRRQRLR